MSLLLPKPNGPIADPVARDFIERLIAFFELGTDIANTFADDTGAMKVWKPATPPAGWLLCNGALVSRTTYSGLFAVIGTSWGAGDGSTTFRLPNATITLDTVVCNWIIKHD